VFDHPLTVTESSVFTELDSGPCRACGRAPADFPGTASFKQLLDPGQARTIVHHFLALKHQQGQSITPLATSSAIAELGARIRWTPLWGDQGGS